LPKSLKSCPVPGITVGIRDVIASPSPTAISRRTVELLGRAGIEISDYPSETGNRPPRFGWRASPSGDKAAGYAPQVANGNFDLALTGRDWVPGHRCRSPPVRWRLGDKFGQVRLVAVVDGDVPRYRYLRRLSRRSQPEGGLRCVNIADKYAG
jgi:ATP phosphoribosyltransferase